VAQTNKSEQSLKNFLKVFERGVGRNFFPKSSPHKKAKKFSPQNAPPINPQINLTNREEI
jgi:hypothetical protein